MCSSDLMVGTGLGAMNGILFKNAAALENATRLTVVVFDNGMYQITGGQPTSTALVTDLVAVARGCGIARSTWARDEEHFDALVDHALLGDGPSFIAARTDDSPPAGVTERDASRIRARFMDGLGVAAMPRGR